MMRWLIAITIVLICSTDLAAQSTPRSQRIWAITSWSVEWKQEVRSSTKETLAGCHSSIKLLYPSQQHELYCTADAWRDSNNADEKAADATTK
jgi:hypothetical protein